MSHSEEAIPSNLIQFQEFCELCEQIQKNKSNKQKQCDILEEFINVFRLKASQITTKKNTTLHPLVRVLLPQCDRERDSYGLRETKLGQLYVKLLSLHKTALDAKKLLNFKALNSQHNESDFASVAYFVLKRSRCPDVGTLTIGDINATLDKISSPDSESRTKSLEDELRLVLLKTTAEQQKWFIRIILKDMKLGMGIHKLLSCVHPNAPELYDSCSSLLKVCEELGDGETHPVESGIKLFYAIRPMAAERLEFKRLNTLPSDKSYHIEIKFDGERFQIHMKDGKYRYFSRRGFDFTNTFGETFESDGLLTPLLRDALNPDVTSFIMDGEMMGWNKNKECFGSKGMAFDVKKLSASSVHRPCFCAFDLLYHDGRPLVGVDGSPDARPLHQRVALLDKLFTPKMGVIQHSARIVVSSQDDIIEQMNLAIQREEEGIVLKDVDSYYKPNRRNCGWYKMKPDYMEGVVNDLDLMIIGGYYAENKRHGLVSSFLLALAEPPEVEGSLPSSWVSVGRVSAGLSDDARASLCCQLRPYWRTLAQATPPAGLGWSKEKPDLWIDPQHSCILQVKASELVKSDAFKAGYALRFPRVVRVRDDKPLYDAMTTTQFSSLVQSSSSVVKLACREVCSADVGGRGSAGRVTRKRAAPAQVAAHFRAASPTATHATSRALQARHVCVLTGHAEADKADLEKLVLRHGGVVVQNPGRDTWCAVAGHVNLRVRSTFLQDVDVVAASWLLELPDSDELAPLPAFHQYLSMSKKTKVILAQSYDPYGDSYTEITDEIALKRCFERIDKEETQSYLTRSEMLDIDKLLFDTSSSPFSFLRPCFIYVHPSLPRLLVKAKMYGARICGLDVTNISHLVVRTRQQMEELKQKQAEGRMWGSFVYDTWLESCFENKSRVSETCFLVE